MEAVLKTTYASNGYSVKIFKIAKHVSEKSHVCIYCNSFLIPSSFSRNLRHHFPWGIVYKCTCGKSGLWTNAIRGAKEFMDVVFSNMEIRNSSVEKGFCNDLFCPICFKWILVLKNGLYLDNKNRAIVYVANDKKYYYVNYDKYIKKYNKSGPLNKYDPKIMEQEAVDISRAVDVEGCSSLGHNLGIIMMGREFEYGEAEYRPIYDWIKSNKSKIPKEMLVEFKQEMA